MKTPSNIFKFILLGFAFGVVSVASAQVKVGDNPASVNPNAVLEIESTDKGLLLPRIALTGTASAAPLSAHVAGIKIYNTATAGDVTPGIYYNDGTKWVRVAIGEDAKNLPWFVQSTSNEATANTQDIYQQGKVAVGFTDADAVSTKQLEVKGDIKATYTGTGVHSIIDNNFSGLEIFPSVTSGEGTNMMMSSDNEDLGSASQANFIYTTNEVSVSGVPFGMSGVVSKYGNYTSGLNVYSQPNGSTAEIAASNPTGRSAGVSVSTTGVMISDYQESSYLSAIDVDNTTLAGSGVRFRFHDVDGDNEGSYLFPRDNGAPNQVLITNGLPPTGVPAQLSWQNVNDLVNVNEPWRIQSTTNEATANTQDIYQQGKVAVGFTEADGESDRQLEVKGDFRVRKETISGQFTGIEVQDAGGIGASSMYSTVDPEDSDAVSATISTVTLGAVTAQAAIRATHPDYESSMNVSPNNIGISSGKNGVSPHIGRIDFQPNSVAANDAPVQISASNGTNAQSHDDRTSINVRKAQGVEFRYYGPGSSNDIGKYTFPREAGAVGQVLGVATATSYGSSGGIDNQLEWRNVSDLLTVPTEPWQVQGDTIQATENTQNIYQQGKVAVGFTEADGVSDRQLEVAGDFKAETSLAGTFSAGPHIYGQGTGGGMFAFPADDLLDPLVPIVGSGNYFVHANGDFDGQSVVSEGGNFSYFRNNVLNNIAGMMAHEKGVDLSTVREDVGMGHFRLANDDARIYVRNFTSSRQSEIGILSDGENSYGGEGVVFLFDGPTPEEAQGYTFPRNTGIAGQVMTQTATGQIVWENASALVTVPTEPWQVQGGTTQATENTQDIYQMGKVGIGTNNMLGTADTDVALAVNGKILTTSSTFADYVFEDYFDGYSALNAAYSFKSLRDVEKFINENRHLPGITKIDALMKNENGDYIINPTELSIQMLEKIEELYLHVIEQHNQMEANSQKIEELETRLERLENLLLDKK